ncbi:MAG: hypothetical protein KDB14_24945 [Planctomycetales bacterium]|nr:hypothetical protein [Planctomycetales bacterium]
MNCWRAGKEADSSSTACLPVRRLLAIAACGILASAAHAQAPIPIGPTRHYMHSLQTEPGTIGYQQHLRVPNAAGYFQPVELRGPEGCLVSLAGDGGFLPDHQRKFKAGLLMGPVYRFRIGNIPLLEGYEVFPTIEVINRLHPPPGMAAKFPIPVEVTREELEMAINGRLVTRVIYLEDPNAATPAPQGKEQPYFDIDRRLDPLQMADRMGRPMAILRMGSRVPLDDELQQPNPPAQVYPEEVDNKLDPPGSISVIDSSGIKTISGLSSEVHPAQTKRYPRLPNRYDMEEPIRPRSDTDASTKNLFQSRIPQPFPFRLR